MNRCLFWRSSHCRSTVWQPGVSLSSSLPFTCLCWGANRVIVSLPCLTEFTASCEPADRDERCVLSLPLQRTGCWLGQSLDTFSSTESRRMRVWWIDRACVWTFPLRISSYSTDVSFVVKLGTNRFEVTLEKSNKNFSKKIQQVKSIYIKCCSCFRSWWMDQRESLSPSAKCYVSTSRKCDLNLTWFHLISCFFSSSMSFHSTKFLWAFWVRFMLRLHPSAIHNGAIKQTRPCYFDTAISWQRTASTCMTCWHSSRSLCCQRPGEPPCSPVTCRSVWFCRSELLLPSAPVTPPVRVYQTSFLVLWLAHQAACTKLVYSHWTDCCLVLTVTHDLAV